MCQRQRHLAQKSGDQVLYSGKRGEYLKRLRIAMPCRIETADLTPGLTSGSNLLVGQKINVPTRGVTN
ncbi:MAG: hypothetical protein U1F13_05890 [Acinetobacter parvus]